MRKTLTIFVLIAAYANALKDLVLGKGEEPADRLGHDEPASWTDRVWTTAKYFIAFAVLMAIGGIILAASGLVPIKASSGHWAVTRWFLEFSKQRSVATHSLWTQVPPLDDTRLILQGAGAYETNCRACHGSPSMPNPRVAQHLTPRPPYLPSTLHKWDDAEVFYIVKHGIKFTGMPAWPAQQRDDEVWAMVAFLRRLSVVDATEYRRLAMGETNYQDEVVPLKGLMGPTDVPGTVAVSCSRCHGADGLGRGTGAFPKLAGQSSTYLYDSLRAYAQNDRHSGVMGPVAAGLSDKEMQELARYYSGLEMPLSSQHPEKFAESVERGRRIALQGMPEKRIPSCISCHGPTTLPRNPAYPELAGQYQPYMELQLRLFNKGYRGGARFQHIMSPIASRLSEQEARDVTLYFSSLQRHRKTPLP